MGYSTRRATTRRRGLRALLAACAAFAVVSLCACNAAGIDINPTSVEEAKQSKVDEMSPSLSSPTIQEDGYLTVGVDLSAQAPFVIQADDGTLSGMDIDIASAIADDLGLKVRFVGLSSVSDEDVANCDIVMGVQSGSNAELTVVGSYAEDAIAFFYKGDATVASADTLNSKTVGVQAGSVSERALSRSSLVMTQSEFSNLNEAFSALDSGTVDYVLCDAYSGGYLAAVYSGISTAGTLDTPSAIGIGMLEGSTELQSAIQGAFDDISSNGVLEVIRTRWVGDMPTLTTESQITGVTEATTDEAATTDETSTDATDASATDATTTDATASTTDTTSADGTTDETATAA
jgi:polar amino acid transport system substrate-binding protein